MSSPRLITDEIAQTRAELEVEDAPLSEEGEPPVISELRAATLGAVLEECAARLRLAAESGHPAGSVDLADLAAELGLDMYRRTFLRE
ncbi:MAG: hypothetical protein ACRCYX_13515 [Dermatophilaceae bacterium]